MGKVSGRVLDILLPKSGPNQVLLQPVVAVGTGATPTTPWYTVFSALLNRWVVSQLS